MITKKNILIYIVISFFLYALFYEEKVQIPKEENKQQVVTERRTLEAEKNETIIQEEKNLENEAYTICKEVIRNSLLGKKIEFAYLERKIVKIVHKQYIIKSRIHIEENVKSWECNIKYIGKEENYLKISNWDYKLSFY